MKEGRQRIAMWISVLDSDAQRTATLLGNHHQARGASLSGVDQQSSSTPTAFGKTQRNKHMKWLEAAMINTSNLKKVLLESACPSVFHRLSCLESINCADV